MLAVTLALAFAVAPVSSTFVVEGTVDDGVRTADGVALIGRRQKQNTMWSHPTRRARARSGSTHSAGAGTNAPNNTRFFSWCGPRGIVFVDESGVVDAKGTRVLAGRPIFGAGVPDRRLALELCDSRGEIRLPIAGGFLVLAPDVDVPVAVPITHHARLYAGQSGAGIPRAYAAAVTTYLPRTFDANVDADPRLEWVVVNERTAYVFDRTQANALRPKPTRVIDLAQAFGAHFLPGGSIRVTLGDVDRDGRDELVAFQFASPLAKETRGVAIGLDRKGPAALLFRDEGVSFPLGVVDGRLLRARIDTSVMSLTSALVTGRLPIAVESMVDASPRVVAEFELDVDVTRGRLVGFLPRLVRAKKRSALVFVDAAHKVHLRSGAKFEDETVIQAPSPVAHVVNGGDLLLLLGVRQRGQTQVTVVRP